MTESDSSIPWERIKAAFDEATDLEGEARESFLELTARDDPGLAQELRSLLARHDEPGEFLSDPTIPPEDLLGLARPADDPVPERVGRYVVERRLGAGGMGQVLLAHDPQLERDVALKLLPEAFARDPVRRERFLREARAAARLSHPHVAALHEVGEADGRDYLAFEYVDGVSLRERIEDGAMDLGELLAIAIPLARALEAAHDQSLVHRDVKAGNVVLDRTGRPKLVDFGLARQMQEGGHPRSTDDSITVRGQVVGTPGAMSPEQALGKPVDHRTDVFSFGSLLYAMAAGAEPFGSGTAIGTLSAVIHATPESLAERRPELPADLVALIERAMEKDVDQRPGSMSEVAEALERIRRSPGSSTRRVARVSRRAVATGVVVVLAIALSWRLIVPRAGHGLAAVLYVENSDDPEDARQLGSMVAHRLALELASGDGLDMLSEQRLYDIARQMGLEDGRIDARRATEVAKRAGLQTMIVGSVGRLGETLVATAEMIDVRSGRSLGVAESTAQDESALFQMVASLGGQLRAALDTPSLTSAERRALERGLTDSVEAWRAYVHGQEALQRGEPARAAEEFAQAATIDAAFALAYFRRAMALTWTGDGDATSLALERARAFSDKLPEDIQLLLEATGPYFLDDTTAALPLLLQVLEGDPFNKDALFMVGEIYTHNATRNDAGAAAAIYDRLLELDPDYSVVYGHALSARLRQGDFEGAQGLLTEWEVRAPSAWREHMGTLALWEGRLDDAAARLAAEADAEDVVDSEVLLGVALLAGACEAPRLSAVVGADVSRIVEDLGDVQGLYRVVALDLRANVLALHGRFVEAAELYRQAAEVPGSASPDGFITNTRSGSRHRLARLFVLRGDLVAARREVDATLAVQPQSPRCLAESVRLALAEDDATRVAADLEQLEAVAAESWSPATRFVLDLARADVALAEGRVDEARDGLEALLASGALMLDWGAHDDSIAPLVRSDLARACLAAGDPHAAAAVLDELLAAGLERKRHPIPWATALGERALLADAAGERERAADFASRFLSHWGDAEPVPALVVAVRALGL